MKICFVFMCVILAVFGIAKADICEIDGHTLKLGETYSPIGNCLLVTCRGPNSFFALTCPDEIIWKAKKYIPQDNSKPYPQCCPHVEY